MQPINKLSEGWAKQIENEILYAYDPSTLDDERIQSIINVKYTTADLAGTIDSCILLSKEEQQELLQLLKNSNIYLMVN